MKTFFLRCDDVVRPDRAFLRVFGLLAGLGLPLSCAVIPAGAGKALAAFFRRQKALGAGVEALQHGLSHSEHSGNRYLKHEFGPSRVYGEQLADLAEGAAGVLRIDVPEEIGITADREELFRVFTNLIRNAFDAGAPNQRPKGVRRLDLGIALVREGSEGSTYVIDSVAAVADGLHGTLALRRQRQASVPDVSAGERRHVRGRGGTYPGKGGKWLDREKDFRRLRPQR